MNAIIALCHFCEAHGPCPIFCTYTLRDTKINEIVNNDSSIENTCPGCNSIGKKIGILSEDSESNANFLSTQTVVINDIYPLVKQAAVRSLSCEVSGNKDGNLVFFGDASRGHVLSYTFQIHDSQARGFFRLFSIVVLMKDKMYLLNVQPFLAQNLQQISSELQSYSIDIHSAEQAKYSERAQRLNSGQASTQPPRSLIELTGQKNIFAFIHSHFTWILWMGTRCLTENISIGLPAFSSSNDNAFNAHSIIELKAKDELPAKVLFTNNDNEQGECIRKCKQQLNEHFVAACYCIAVGIQVVLRGSPAKTIDCIKCFGKLLPESMQHLISIESDQYLAAEKCRILSVLSHVAVPQPSEHIFRIEFIDDSNDVHVKWSGSLPNKLPDLLTRIFKSIDETLLTDFVLQKQIRVLVEEWKNKVMCLRTISSNQDLHKVKKVLGVQPNDQLLINYWSSALTD